MLSGRLELGFKQAVNGFAVTPFAAFSVPMMNYEVIGFATGGRHLKAGHFGVSVGRTDFLAWASALRRRVVVQPAHFE